MKRVLLVVLLAAMLVALTAVVAMPAKADGPYGYGMGYGYVFPGSGYNKVCMYSGWNCVYRFVPPAPVSGYYKFPYNTYFKPYVPYNPCKPGLLCTQYGGGGGYGGGGYGW